eukprot:1141473-Pelagomonas_calceolata.AAC.1
MSNNESGGNQEPSWTQTLAEAQKQVDESIRVGARELGKGVLSLRDTLGTSYSTAAAYINEGKVGCMVMHPRICVLSAACMCAKLQCERLSA